MQSTAASASESMCWLTPELVKLRNVVENGFTHDWILRIEHASGRCDSSCGWQEWGEPAFAVTSAKQLLTDVAECRMTHPTHAIRLCAEKWQPRTKMLYCICEATETVAPAVQTIPDRVASMDAANDRLAGVASRLLSINSRTWVTAIVAGVLVSSLLII